jgi:hypothetical protein
MSEFKRQLKFIIPPDWAKTEADAFAFLELVCHGITNAFDVEGSGASLHWANIRVGSRNQYKKLTASLAEFDIKI